MVAVQRSAAVSASSASSETSVGFIDLSSDTATKPSPEMRRAMAEAPVGDDQRGEDPTVNALQEEGAELLGKEAALFLPSATMANQIAIKVQTQPGDEVLCHALAHVRRFEGGAPAVLSGVMICPLPGERGIFTAEDVIANVRPADPHYPRTRLVSVENTHNAAGGCIWKPEEQLAVADAARANGLALHLDGSRLCNAAVALDIPAATLAAPFDTVTLCLSKGLGAPVGALLAGDEETIREARRWKHVFGGAMRQAGIIAAGGLHALWHHIDRLHEDHANAALLAEGLAAIPGVRLDPAPETNLVFVDISGTGLTATEAMGRLLACGVRASQMGPARLRFVTHLDISRADIDTAVVAARSALAGAGCG